MVSSVLGILYHMVSCGAKLQYKPDCYIHGGSQGFPMQHWDWYMRGGEVVKHPLWEREGQTSLLYHRVAFLECWWLCSDNVATCNFDARTHE